LGSWEVCGFSSLQSIARTGRLCTAQSYIRIAGQLGAATRRPAGRRGISAALQRQGPVRLGDARHRLFKVEDGEIVGRTQGDLKKNEFLVTEKPYGDFVLKAKVKIRNGNSGIQFRSKRQPDGVVSGPQADVAEGYWGLFYEERGRGILERYPEEKANALVKKDDWNDFVITARGDHVTIDLNVHAGDRPQ
jgi:hypothetical protein